MNERDLLQRLQRLERATAGSRDGFWERDLKRNTSWYSDSFRTMLGFGPGDLPDDRNIVNARMHPDDRVVFLASYQRAIETISPFDYETRYLDANDEWRWLRGRGQVWAGADGQAELIAGAISDVTTERKALQSLEALSARIAGAIEASAEGLFERVLDEPVGFLSDRMYELLGLAPGEVRFGRSEVMARMHPDDREGFLAAEALAIAARGRYEHRVRFLHASGDHRWFRVRGIVRAMPDGRLKVIGMAADVHEQTLQRQELENAHDRLEALVEERTSRLEAALALAHERQGEAERANAAKSRFLAHMSHEIRTPLNGVLGLVELARRTATSPDQLRYLEFAQQAGQTLQQMLTDVLDLSRIEAGRVEVKTRPVDVANALAEGLRAVLPLMRQRSIHVGFDWTDGPTWALADDGALRQIVTNLAGNAIKFTERGMISVVGGSTPRPDGRLDVAFSVTDSGPGIPVERRAAVFDPFVQGDDSLSRSHGGAGLGLAIARALARAMGGDITLDASPPGGGTRFTVRLTLAATAQPAPAPAPPPGLAWLVYIVPEGADWLTRRLGRLGWRCTALTSVAEALARSRSETPQLVVLTVSTLRGEHPLAELRAALPAVPIRLLIRPDWLNPELEAEARALGVVPAVAPLTPLDLRHIAAPSPEPVTADDGSNAWPLGAEVLLVEDNPVNQLIGKEFLGALGVPARTANDGAEAVDACLARPPALVLMDLQMPGMDGLEAARRLRELQRASRWPGAPIIALTAHAGDADRAACLAAGMDGVLTKPLSIDTLRLALRRWLVPIA